MLAFTYAAIRKAPAIGGTIGAFVVSSWIAADLNGFKAWLADLDISRTAALVAILIAAYVTAYFLSRKWNSTDRDFYKGELRTIYNNVGSWKFAAEHVGTDVEWQGLFAEIDRIMRLHQQWINTNMGEAALTRFQKGEGGPALSFPWQGDHAPELRAQRSLIITTLGDRLVALRDLMEKDLWDHPVPLAKRARAERWSNRKAWLWKKIGRASASTDS